jgi:tetratricopeptide (TPR) repeat protein
MRSALVFCLLLTVTACAGSQRAVIKPIAYTDDGREVAEVIREADEKWEDRLNESSLRAAIDLYEKAFAADPQNAHVLDQLTLAYYQLGYAYTTETAERLRLHDRGRHFGLKRLEQHPGYKAAVDSRANMREAASRITEAEYVNALLMTSANWGWWGELQGITRVAFDIPRVRALFERALELDPDYNCSGPRSMAAAFYAKAGTFGGDMNKSRELYEEAIQDQQCLDNRVLFAEFWAVPMDDRELFTSLLTSVIEAPEDTDSRYRLENAVAKRNAQRLLQQIDRLF